MSGAKPGEVEYEPVIGLEVHAQLRTRTKIFCGCENRFGDPPNTHTCEICLGHPGTLPVLNERAVELAIRLGLACGCTIHPKSVFARKNYFYADLPKGYHISQFDQPLCEGGAIPVGVGAKARKIGLVRIHMEEDAGKLLHEGQVYTEAGKSVVDFNRSGIPLVEIVGKPEIRSAAEAADYLRALHSIVVYLDVCDGNMEEGSFRCDANVSVRPKGQAAFGTRIELKNMNSFRNVEKAIEYEIDRQIREIKAGGKIVQETRTWNADQGKSFSMRSKEEAHDYRYFPEPDLVPLAVDERLRAKVAASMPELGHQKAERYVRDLGLSDYDAGVLTADPAKAAFFEAALAAGAEPKASANWITVELFGLLNKEGLSIGAVKFAPKEIAELLKLIASGAISGKQAKEVFAELYAQGGAAAEIVKAKGLVQLSDESALAKVVDEVLAANPDKIAAYKGGNERLFGFFVGQAMKATGGKANPKILNDLIRARIG